MKNKYFLYLFVTITFVFALGLYFLDIPAPSIVVSEKYSLILK